MWCYAPIESNGANFVHDRYMLPALELVREHSLDTIGTKAIDHLGETLKIKMDQKKAEGDLKQAEKEGEKLKNDVAQVVDKAVGNVANAIGNKVADQLKERASAVANELQDVSTSVNPDSNAGPNLSALDAQVPK